MSDFISREKELLKLNEEIDKKAQLGADRRANSSRVLSPRNAKVSSTRRASIEVDKLNLRCSSRISAPKNSSLPRPTLKKEKDPRNSPNHIIASPTQILGLARAANSSPISDRKIRTPSKIPSPKNDSKSLDSKKCEKPPIKPKISQIKASTMPRNNKNVSSLSRKSTAKEQVLLEINSKLDKKAKKVLDDAKENIERPKSISTKTFTSSEKSTRSPPGSPSKQIQGRQTPSPVSKGLSNTITETYRNKNFKESPSTEALPILFKELHGDSKSSPSDTNKTKDAATSSIKKPLKQLATHSQKLNKRTVSTEGLIKYLKSKLGILETELEENTALLKKKSDELHASHDKQKKLETQRDQVISKNNALTEQMGKLEDKLSSVERQFKDKEAENTANLRELETLRRELRVITQANVNLEKRLYRANEELENIKNNLSSMKEAEREIKESGRQEKQAQEKQIKTLKRQRSELLSAYKKQLYLIDNLRRQNICMEQSRLVSFGEKEFTKVLEWNTHN